MMQQAVKSGSASRLARLKQSSWRTQYILGLTLVLAVVLQSFASSVETLVLLADAGSDGISFAVSAAAVGYPCLGLLAVLLVLSCLRKWKQPAKASPKWLVSLAGLAFALPILLNLFAGKQLTLVNLLAGALALSVPLVFGALASVFCERVGVINIAIEGQLLAGAFLSAVVASVTGNLWLGIIAALVAGALVSLVLAVFSIRYVVDQIIVGVVLNVFVLSLTSFLFSTLLSNNSEVLNSPPRLDKIAIPGLVQIPVLGPVLFNQTIIVYLMYFAVGLSATVIFKTRWGLRMRAVGEYPKAADTVGIKVLGMRYSSVVIGGALAGLGGAFYTLGQVGAFGKEMTNGAGYIALAAMIFGRWHPIWATCAALFFGFAQNLQYALSITGSNVPNEFLQMLPYVLTIVAVAGLVGKVRGPASVGKAYVKT